MKELLSSFGVNNIGASTVKLIIFIVVLYAGQQVLASQFEGHVKSEFERTTKFAEVMKDLSDRTLILEKNAEFSKGVVSTKLDELTIQLREMNSRLRALETKR